MITWLKAKYRSKNYKEVLQEMHGGRILTRIAYTSGTHASKSSNNTKKNTGKKLAPRRRAYGPWYVAKE